MPNSIADEEKIIAPDRQKAGRGESQTMEFNADQEKPNSPIAIELEAEGDDLIPPPLDPFFDI